MASARGKKKAPNVANVATVPNGPDADFQAALSAVRASPHDLAAWARLEAIGTEQSRAGDVAAAYRTICTERPDLANVIGLRAVEFHDDWGEDPATVAELVERMFAGSPDAHWALDRLKLTYSSEARWTDLLAVFDTALAGATDDEARAILLEDAARVAKDFARDMDRAISYSERLFEVSRDERTRASLEKLYEKSERHEALIGLYRTQLPGLTAAAAQSLRGKMASLWLTIGEVDRAFEVIEEMLAVKADEPLAFDLLEKIFAVPARSITDPGPASSAPLSTTGEGGVRSTRQRAALLLKPHYIAGARSRELVRVLQVELAVATTDAARAATYRELVTLQLETLNDDAGAMFALAALVVLEPEEPANRKLLELVAARLGRVDRRAKVLMTAAERAIAPAVRASLLLEAAAVCRGPLASTSRAIDLYQRVLALTGLDSATLLDAARELSTLLATADRIQERCLVLERLAELETDPALRRAALGEVARIASADFGDTERAITAWRARLADDPADLDAVAGMRTALTSQSRWRELATVLEKAASKASNERSALLLEAATICERDLDDLTSATRLLEDLYRHTPEDVSVMERLSGLYRQQSRHVELLALKKRQVGLAENKSERVRLRLEIAEVLADMGDEAERVVVLEANLQDEPLESKTAQNLAAALESLGRYAELLDLWESQAELNRASGNSETAASLWTRSGTLAETRLTDLDRALRAHEKAGNDPISLDSLARLYSARDQPLDAAIALERLLPLSGEDARIPTLLRLASAYVAGGRRDSARKRLEEELEAHEDPRVSLALADIYRADEAWGPLADLLAVQARAVRDDAPRAELLREAAELYLNKRSDAAAAIPLLEEALAISTTKVPITLMLAPALVEVGRGEDSAALLRKRIAEFGARRPKERALVHHALSRALLALGRNGEALSELDVAVKIDPLNLPTRRALADATADSGDLEAARRMYRSLLLVVPRQESKSPLEIARSEILICLADVAERLNDAAEATECFESAIAAARENNAERVAAERELGARGRYGVLAELLLERLDVADAEQAAAACDRLAVIYEEHLERGDDALVMRLRALSLTPIVKARHAAAVTLARALGNVSAYVDLVAAECARAKAPEVSYELRALLGDALEEDGKLEDAAREFEDAERAALELEPHTTGGRRLDHAWKSLDRIYRALGDDVARAPVLARRADASEARRDPLTERADLLYELASIELAHSDSVSAGLDTLSRAIAAFPRPDRTEMALLAALDVDRTNERALRMYESLSRAPGRERALIDALQRLGSLPGLSRYLLEAARLAETIGDPATAEALLRRFVLPPEAPVRASMPPPSPTRNPDMGEALLALSLLRANAGDVREAALLKERAAARFDRERARPILLEVATLAAGRLADLPQAARIYTELLAESPTDRQIWEPLLSAYRSLNDVASLSALVDSVAPLLDDPQERARLRLDQATLLLRALPVVPSARPPADVVDDDGWGPVWPTQWPKSLRPPSSGSIPPPRTTSRPPRASHPVRGTDRAEAALWKVLDDDEANVEATAMLTSLFERAERVDDLAKLLGRQLETAKKAAQMVSASGYASRLGTLHEESGREEEAIAAWREAVELDPTNRAAHRALMRLSENTQDPREVRDATEILLNLEVGTEAERLALRLASLNESLGETAGVRRALEAGLERHPESQALRERLIESFQKNGEWKELAEHHLAASETRSAVADRVEELRLAAGVMRRELSDPKGAAEILERALVLAPNDRNVLLLLINSWSSAGDHARAVRAVDVALVDGPEDQEALFHMRAVLHGAGGAREEALADLETAFTLSGGAYGEELAEALDQFVASEEGAQKLDLRMRLVEVLYGLERFDEACSHLAEILKRDPSHRDARAILAALDARAGRVDEAIESYLALLKLEDGETLVNVTMAFADVCEEHGRLEELVPALERARIAAPDHAGIRKRLEAAYSALGDKNALATLILEEANAATLEPKKFELLSTAARLLIDAERGDPARAMTVLAEARALRPDDPDTGVLLADALTASGKTGEALDLLERLVVAQKRRSKVRSLMHSRIADLYAKMGAQMGALQSLVKAMDDDPHDAGLAMRTGLAGVELNDLDAMTRAFRTVTLMKTVRLGVTEGGAPSAAKCIAYYHLARVAQRQGDIRKARLMVEKSLGESTTPEARALRDALKG